MLQMEIKRRTFVGGLASSILAGTPGVAAGGSVEAVFAANIVERNGGFAAVAYSAQMGLLRKQSLPGRGHDLTYNQATGLLIAFARRPGNFAVAFDYRGNRAPITFTTPADRHFYGHGVFSIDGRLLYATENDFENAAGIIGIYDVQAGFKRLGELKSYGVGPHDIALLSDGRTLVVANGGIETHPLSGRKPLNLAAMKSSLTYIDRETGDLSEQHELSGDQQKLSIRHFDVARNDVVVLGCQFKGPKWQEVDLVGFHQRGHDIEFLASSPAVTRALRHYVSSIAVSQDRTRVGITSSRGEQIVYVDVEQKKIVGISRFSDVSGVAPDRRGGFVLTGGYGHWTAGVPQPDTIKREAWSWDNHAIAI